MGAPEGSLIKQHLIDPEICIRCNTCETMCPVGAITHDSNNYVVDADKCNWCNACISPCPTGSIDNYRTMPRVRVYTLDEQLSWGSLPNELPPEELAAAGAAEVSANRKWPPPAQRLRPAPAARPKMPSRSTMAR